MVSKKKPASASNDPKILTFYFFSFDIKLRRAIPSVFRHLVSGFHSNSEMGNISSSLHPKYFCILQMTSNQNLSRDGPGRVESAKRTCVRQFHRGTLPHRSVPGINQIASRAWSGFIFSFSKLFTLHALYWFEIYFQNFVSFMITRWEELVTDWVSAMP